LEYKKAMLVKDGKKYDKHDVAVESINGNRKPLHWDNHFSNISKYLYVLL
jgi:hypothetical protein